MVSMSDKIKLLYEYKGISQAELARKIGWSTTNLNNKLQRSNLSEKDLQAIAAALDAEFEGSFILKDSKQKF